MKLRTVLVCILALVSCIKKDPPKDSLGPEVARSDVSDALNKPIMHSDPTTMKVGEFTWYENDQKAPQSNPIVTSDVEYDVIERTETATDINLTILETKTEYKTGNPPVVTKTEIPLVLKKGLQPLAQILSEGADCPLAQDDNDQCTFHNLKSVTRKEYPPDRVKDAPNCLGIPSCLISVTQVDFDEVLTSGSDGTRTQYHFEIHLSPDVPFLSRTLNTCIYFLAKIDGKDVPVRVCSPVLNFAWGH